METEKNSINIDGIYHNKKRPDAVCEYCGCKFVVFADIDFCDCPNCERKVDLRE